MMNDCKHSDWLSLINKRFRLQLNIDNGVVGSTALILRRVGFETRYLAKLFKLLGHRSNG